MSHKIVPETLKAFRKGRDLSQEELADQSGVSLATIKRIEACNEIYTANGVAANRLGAALDLPTEELAKKYYRDIPSIACGPYTEVRILYFRNDHSNGKLRLRHVATDVCDEPYDEMVLVQFPPPVKPLPASFDIKPKLVKLRKNYRNAEGLSLPDGS